MAHSSLPIYLDPPNWQQSNNQAAAATNDHQIQDPRQLPAFLPPPPPSAAGHGGGIRPGSMAYRARLAMIPQPEAALKCPRCDSTNTKFCYFNNYSLSQPRHFCKTCRRYWTRGGALRNVPVGGGFRKNKKKKKSNNRSKSPTTVTETTTQIGNLRSMGGSASAIMSTTTNSHFPLPSIPSLQLQHHLSRSALNFAGIHIGNLNSGREFDHQWCNNNNNNNSQPPPFIVAGLETPAAAVYPLNMNQITEEVNNSSLSGVQYNCHQQQQQQLQNSTPFSRIPLKNNEEQNQEQGILMSNFLRPAENSQFWGGDHHNSWTDLSALSSSSSSHLL